MAFISPPTWRRDFARTGTSTTPQDAPERFATFLPLASPTTSGGLDLSSRERSAWMAVVREVLCLTRQDMEGEGTHDAARVDDRDPELRRGLCEPRLRNLERGQRTSDKGPSQAIATPFHHGDKP